MPPLTEGRTPGDFLLFEENSRYSREVATIAAGADLEPGAVLGKVTASGKYVLSAQDAADGSETPVAILLSVAAATDADVVDAIVLVRHAQVRRFGLTFDATWSSEALRDTACAALGNAGIVAI